MILGLPQVGDHLRRNRSTATELGNGIAGVKCISIDIGHTCRQVNHFERIVVIECNVAYLLQLIIKVENLQILAPTKSMTANLNQVVRQGQFGDALE